MSDSYTFMVGETHSSLGYCMARTDMFLTLVTPNPPAAETAAYMASQGWEVYYQPVPYFWLKMSTTKDSWITTYRKIPNVQVQH